MKKRFIVNTSSKVIHDRWHKGERCNLDDADEDNLEEHGTSGVEVRLRDSKVLWRLCDWCLGSDEEED